MGRIETPKDYFAARHYISKDQLQSAAARQQASSSGSSDSDDSSSSSSSAVGDFPKNKPGLFTLVSAASGEKQDKPAAAGQRLDLVRVGVRACGLLKYLGTALCGLPGRFRV